MPRRKKVKKSTQQVVSVPSNVTDAIQYLELENDSISRERLLAAIRIVSETASSLGLTAEFLIRLVDIIGSAKFTDMVNRKLIACLIPNIRVPDDAIISALSWICTRKLLISSQKLLTQWIVASLYYDVIDRTHRLHKLYNVVFCLLQYEDLCPYICHLLFLLTRKEDITLYHIQKLVSLQLKVGSQPYILGLLNLYHQLQPDLVFIQPKPLKYFRSVKRWHLLAEVPSRAIEFSHRVHLRLSTPQNVALLLGQHAKILQYQNLVSIIDGMDNFLTVVKSPHRRILISSSEDTVMKFKLHLMLELEDEWFSNKTNEAGSELLKTLANVYTETREDLGTAELVIGRFLNTYDGSRFYKEFLRVVPHLEMCTFDQLRNLLMDRLLGLFQTSEVPFQLETIHCLSLLFQNWVLFKYNPTENATDLSSSAMNDDSETLLRLASYIDNLCIIGSMQHPESDERFHFAGLDFYSIVLNLIDLGCLDVLLVPSASIVFGSLFTFSAARLSQLCLLVVRYKSAIIKLRTLRSRHNTQALESGIQTLNSYVKDICNTLWKCKGFIPRSTSGIYKENLPISIVNTVEETRTLFAVYRHPALVVSIMEFLRKSHDISIEPRDIMTNSAVRVAFNQYLSSCNYSSIPSFLETFIKVRSEV